MPRSITRRGFLSSVVASAVVAGCAPLREQGQSTNQPSIPLATRQVTLIRDYVNAPAQLAESLETVDVDAAHPHKNVSIDPAQGLQLRGGASVSAASPLEGRQFVASFGAPEIRDCRQVRLQATVRAGAAANMTLKFKPLGRTLDDPTSDPLIAVSINNGLLRYDAGKGLQTPLLPLPSDGDASSSDIMVRLTQTEGKSTLHLIVSGQDPVSVPVNNAGTQPRVMSFEALPTHIESDSYVRNWMVSGPAALLATPNFDSAFTVAAQSAACSLASADSGQIQSGVAL